MESTSKDKGRWFLPVGESPCVLWRKQQVGANDLSFCAHRQQCTAFKLEKSPRRVYKERRLRDQETGPAELDRRQ